MPNFAYVAKGRSGEELSGVQSGVSIDDVVGKLHAKGLVVLHVAETRAGQKVSSLAQRFAGISIGSTSTRNLALFTRQLATVLTTGIPLVRGLVGLSADTSNRSLSRTVRNVAQRIEQGQSLSEAMVAHPRTFNTMYVSMVRAGERAGTLDEILEELAVYLEKMDAIKTKVRAAMAYPVFVMIFALLATMFLLLKIVPTFQEIYADFGQELPAMTLFVIGISNAIRANFLLSVGIAAAVLAFFLIWTRTPSGRYAMHYALIKMPVFGPIVRKAVMSRFARTFGILMKSGLPILESLELVKGAAGNAVVSAAIDDAKAKIGSGQEITGSFRSTKKFPEMLLQLMGTGEESGNLDAMLLKTSDFYDRQVEASVHGLTSLIEPLLVVVVGGMIGVIVVTMFLPIFYLGEAILKGGYTY